MIPALAALDTRFQRWDEERSIRFDTLAIMNVCRTFHDIARPFLYELVFLRSRPAFDSFWCTKGFKRGGRMGKADWRKDDYAHVRSLGIGRGYKIDKFALPFGLSRSDSENPFPKLEILRVDLQRISSWDCYAPFAKVFFYALRATTPQHVIVLATFQDPILVHQVAYETFKASLKTTSIVLFGGQSDDAWVAWWESVRSDPRVSKLAAGLFRMPEDKGWPTWRPPR